MPMTKNTNCTRFYSAQQEEEVAKVINGTRQSNSGAGHFNKGDVINRNASILVECKCSTSNKDSFSVKKEWFEKNKQESFGVRTSNQCVAFNFGPDSESLYIINKKLMRFLIEKLEEDARSS